MTEQEAAAFRGRMGTLWMACNRATQVMARAAQGDVTQREYPLDAFDEAVIQALIPAAQAVIDNDAGGDGPGPGPEPGELLVPFTGSAVMPDTGDTIFGKWKGTMAGQETEFGTDFTKVGIVNWFPAVFDYGSIAMVQVAGTDSDAVSETGTASPELTDALSDVVGLVLHTPTGSYPIDTQAKVALGNSYVWMGTLPHEVFAAVVDNPSGFWIAAAE